MLIVIHLRPPCSCTFNTCLSHLVICQCLKDRGLGYTLFHTRGLRVASLARETTIYIHCITHEKAFATDVFTLAYPYLYALALVNSRYVYRCTV